MEVKVPSAQGQTQWVTATGTENWDYYWDTTTVFNGAYSISVRAYDGKDYSSEVRVEVYVSNTSPDDGGGGNGDGGSSDDGEGSDDIEATNSIPGFELPLSLLALTVLALLFITRTRHPEKRKKR